MGEAMPYLLSFKAGTALVEEPDGRIRLDSPCGAFALNAPAPGLRLALQTLASSAAAEDELAEQVVEADGIAALPHVYYLLTQLRALGLLSYSVAADGRPFLTLEPLAPSFRPAEPAPDAGQRFILSRFAYCRRLHATPALESPLAHARAILQGPAGAALPAALAEARSSRELAAAVQGIDEQSAHQALALLAGAGLVCEARDDGSPAEDGDEALRQWEFHDLLFHARSRLGRNDAAAGGTFRFLGRIPPRPAIKPPMSADLIPLHRPDLDRLMEADLPLTRAIERRVSVREQGEPPITAAQLGEFLYRTARVRSLAEPDPANNRPYAVSSRPYPGGGAAHELEIYLTIDACEDIPAGLYHYEPAQHALSRLSEPTAQTQALQRRACAASGMSRAPQVLLTIAARFQRLSWKYESIAYATVLKDTGVLYQTMYLVAMAMGLAPCALGGGDADLLAEAAGLHYLEESSVGEFMLGSRPTSRRGGGGRRAAAP